MSKTAHAPRHKKRLSLNQQIAVKRNRAIGRVAATKSHLTNNLRDCEDLLVEKQYKALVQAQSLVQLVYDELAFKYYKTRRKV